MRKWLPYGIIILLFLLHLPFLTADPDTQTDLHTRGAWTDEGLYSSQVRNFLNTGTFEVKENSTFVRGPLYNVIQLPFFYFFGSGLVVSRLIVLISLLLALFLFLVDEKLRQTGIFLAFLVATQYHLFHFSHYGLAEMLCNSFILYSLWFLIHYLRTSGKQSSLLLLSATCLFAAYSCKIQYLYVAAILPITLLYLGVERQVKHKEPWTKAFRGFFLASGFSLLLSLVYLAWYLANRGFYDHVMLNEVNGRYPNDLHTILAVFRFNVATFLWVKGLATLWILLFAALPGIGIWILLRKQSGDMKVILTFSLVWILLEMHKLPMTYLPNRYLLSLFLATGLMASAIFSILYDAGKGWKLGISILASLVMLMNSSAITKSYRSRTYDLQAVNNYLKKTSFHNEYALGSWATAVSWNTGLRTIPVWNHYFNDKAPLETYHPRLVIVEDTEAETDQAFRSNGMNLDSIADSVRIFPIWRYKVKVYWMEKD
jgi:4-amino-4-deoxy-L-arabinose transferase-like glycosyltransferase